MENISENNLDEILFEYFEGNLSAEDMASVEGFVKEHPHFQADFDAWKASYYDAEEVDYPLAGDLLAGSKGAIWMRWAVGGLIVLLAGGGIWAWMSNSSGEVPAAAGSHEDSESMIALVDEPVYTDIEQMEERVEATAPSSQNGSTQSPKQTSNSEALQSRQLATKADPNAGNASQSGQSSSQLVREENRSDRNETVSSSMIEEGTAEVSPVEVGEFMSYRGNYDPSLTANNSVDDLNNVALMEAMDYFSDPDKGSANGRQYQDRMDDHMEGKVASERRASGLSRFMRKIGDAFRQPLGLINLNDPNYALPGLRSPVYFNPSFTGSMLTERVELEGYGRWLGTDQGAIGGYLNYDGYIKPLHGGLGMTVRYNYLNDGALQDIEAAIMYSPKFRVSRNVSLEPSVQYSYGMTIAEHQQLSELGTFEPQRGLIYNTSIAGIDTTTAQTGNHNMAFGMLFNTRRFYAGVGVHNLFRPEYLTYAADGSKPYQSPVRVSAQIGTDYQYLSRNQVTISPYMIFNHQGDLNEFWGGVTGSVNGFAMGASVSSKLNAAALIGYQGKAFRIGYQIDYSQSAAMDQRSLSHGIMLRLLPARVGKTDGYLEVGLGG